MNNTPFLNLLVKSQKVKLFDGSEKNINKPTGSCYIDTPNRRIFFGYNIKNVDNPINDRIIFHSFDQDFNDYKCLLADEHTTVASIHNQLGIEFNNPSASVLSCSGGDIKSISPNLTYGGLYPAFAIDLGADTSLPEYDTNAINPTKLYSDHMLIISGAEDRVFEEAEMLSNVLSMTEAGALLKNVVFDKNGQTGVFYGMKSSGVKTSNGKFSKYHVFVAVNTINRFNNV